MRPRILLNLVAFAALGVVLCIWALTSIVTVDAIRKPFTVQAEFLSSPGLREDLEITYLGVQVGSVDSVKLDTGKVVVNMHLNHGVVVPSNAKAAVLRKSAVGEPYIALDPSDDGSDARPLHEGDRIPLERTSVAVDYKQLFDSAGNLLKAVRPEDAKTILHELSVGLEGRDTTLRDLIGDTHQLTGTLADNSEVLDQLSVQLTELTKVLADGGPQLASGLDGLAAFNSGMADRSKDLDSILNQGPQFLNNTLKLLETSRPGISCLLTALGTPAPSVFTPEASKQLGQALGLLSQRVPKILDKVIAKDEQGRKYLKIIPVFTAGGPVPQPKDYATPLTGPKTPQLYYCTKAYQNASDLKEKTGQNTERAPAQAVGPFTKVEAPVQAKPASSPSPTGRWLPILPILLAAVVLAVTTRRTLRVMRKSAR